MVLSDAQALDLLTNQKNLQQKAEALRWQNRVRFHGLTVRNKSASAYWPTFREWVFGVMIVADKREMFDAIFPFPTPATSVLAEVQDAMMKVFDSVNPHLIIDAAEGVETDLLNYLDESGEPDFWPDEAIAALFESHEDILLVDIQSGADGRPEPYLTRVPLDSVISVVFNPDATCEHLAYLAADGSKVVVDSASYRVYIKNEAGADVLATSGVYPHNLGRCPARKLWDERVPNHAVASTSVIDECLSLLDEYAMFYVFYLMFKLYGAMPIYYGAEQEEDLTQPAKIIPTNSDGTPDAGYRGTCYPEARAGSSFVAPGDFYGIKPGGDLTVPPVGIVEPSVKSLVFHATDIASQKNTLVGKLAGIDGESNLMNKAVNEKQVAGGFIDKQTKLQYVSRHLSAARQWGILTIGQLRSGDRLKSVDFSFGTEFYLQSETDLWTELETAKAAGAPQTILYEKIQGIQAFRLRTGGNPTRSQILMDLEPLIEADPAELLTLIPLGLIRAETVAVKKQFTDLIRLMERTFGADITQIGAALPYPLRNEKLTKFLYDHVNYQRPEPASANAPNDGGATGQHAANNQRPESANSRPEPAQVIGS